MDKIELSAYLRENSQPPVLRAKNLIVGTVYGHSFPSVSIQIHKPEFLKVFKQAGRTGLIELTVGGDTHPVLIHRYQLHPISREFLNVEFYKVSLTEKITTKIPLVLVGESPAVKLGGYLFENINEIEIECLPQDIVKHIEVDISNLLEINDQIVLKELTIPANIELLTDKETLVAKIQPPQAEEVEEVEAATTAPEVIGEKKDEEEATEK